LTETFASNPAAPRVARRHLGAHRGEAPGPLLLCIASLHGNEPSGSHATLRVIGQLAAAGPPMRGDLVALAGNLSALAAGARFIDEDLNRVWQRGRVAAVLESLRAEDTEATTAGPTPGGASENPALPMVGTSELAEQRQLIASIREAVQDARGPVYVLDLHTTSSESAPFTTLGDTLQNRALARSLPVPVVLGLEEQIDGAMLQYFDLLGWAGIGIEAGAHDDPASIDAHTDVIWVLLAALGLLDPEHVPDLERCRARLARAAADLPRVVDVRYRHPVSSEDGFVMNPGFRNFERVRKGQVLGSDRMGPVAAPTGGRLFLPLYQKQGDDGFFVVRRVRPVWLAISRWLRRRGLDRRATWIPGVIPHPDRTDAVVLARWATNGVVIGILHLLGFNARHEKGRVVLIRRVESAANGGPLDLRH